MAQTNTELELHPFNTDFSWPDHTGPLRRLSEEQVRRFDEQGFVVLEGVFADADLDPVLEELDRREAKAEAWLREQEGERMAIAEAGAITFTPNLVRRSETLKAFSKHPVVLDICFDLVGPDVNMYWDQAVYKKPEKPRRFPWHQDNGYKYVEPQAYLTCWVPLTDATLENGCPQVATRLHRLGTLKHHYVDPLGWEIFEDPPEPPAVAEVAKGGVVIFSSLTPHLTGPNTTEAVRKAYILQYAPVGAYALEGDVESPTKTTQDDPEYQYPVLRSGEPA